MDMATAKRPTQQPAITEKYGSTILGFIVVLIIGLFLFNVFRGDEDKNDTGTVGDSSETSEDGTTEEGTTTIDEKGNRVHVVAQGETLWSIAEEEYQSGYNWTDIAKANNLTDADHIEGGQELIIPEVTPMPPTAAESGKGGIQTDPEPTAQAKPEPTKEAAGQTSDATSYTVQYGDNLWNIAVKMYNDGYQWTKIAQANDLTNPDIIHAGNTLTIPR